MVIGDGLVTPPESEGATPGVTRLKLIEAAAEIGVAARIEPVAPAMLERAPLILTNSVIGAAPAVMLNRGAPPSALASRIAAAYERKLELAFSGRPE